MKCHTMTTAQTIATGMICFMCDRVNIASKINKTAFIGTKKLFIFLSLEVHFSVLLYSVYCCHVLKPKIKTNFSP